MTAPGLRWSAGAVAVGTRTPVVVITGYLGAGKTTFISELLRRPGMEGAAVIVNELAAVGVDQAILADCGADEVVVLANGCLCCAAGGDLRNAVARVLRSRAAGAPPRLILIETSGAADPGPILRQICLDPLLRSQVRNGGVLTLFDCRLGRDMLARDPVGLRQIGLADAVLISKADLAGASERAEAAAYVRSLNPSARIVEDREAGFGWIAAAGKGVAGIDLREWLGAVAPSASHDGRLLTWSLESGERLDWARVEPALAAAFDLHGEAALRTKGVLWTSGDERPLVIQGIGRHFHRPVRLSGWSFPPSTRLAIIGFPEAAPAIPLISAAIGGVVSSNA
jgi:G3E family GTPase